MKNRRYPEAIDYPIELTDIELRSVPSGLMDEQISTQRERLERALDLAIKAHERANQGAASSNELKQRLRTIIDALNGKNSD